MKASMHRLGLALKGREPFFKCLTEWNSDICTEICVFSHISRNIFVLDKFDFYAKA